MTGQKPDAHSLCAVHPWIDAVSISLEKASYNLLMMHAQDIKFLITNMEATTHQTKPLNEMPVDFAKMIHLVKA